MDSESGSESVFDTIECIDRPDPQPFSDPRFWWATEIESVTGNEAP